MNEEDFWKMHPSKFFLLTKTHAEMNDPEKAKKTQVKELSIQEAKRWAGK